MRLRKAFHNPILYFFFFFIYLFAYFFFIFQPSLYAHLHQPIFLFHKIYLKELLLYPGGLAEWLTEFLLQFFYFNGLGSMISALVFLSIFVVIFYILKRYQSARYHLILSSVPVGMLLLLQSQYHFPFLIASKTLITLIFFLIYLKSKERYPIGLILLSGLIYYLLGGWFFLLYMVLCLIDAWFFSVQSKKIVFMTFTILIASLVPLIAARFIFIITIKEAYFYTVPYSFYLGPFSFQSGLFLYLALLSLPTLLVFIFIVSRLKSVSFFNRWTIGFSPLAVQFVTAVVISSILLLLTFRRSEKVKIQIDRLAYQGKWQALLKIYPEFEGYDRLVNFHVNRALYHTGQLLDRLFYYPQLAGTEGLFINRKLNSQIAIPASDLYFELGHINGSQAMAFEAQTQFQYNPRVLKRLALIGIVKGDNGFAKKCIDLLKTSLVFRRWAISYESYLEDPSIAESDPLIQLKRSQQPQMDFMINTAFPNNDLEKLFTENENNKMAFEYLMATTLLDGKLGSLLTYLDYFRNTENRDIPRHIEEAILLIKVIFPEKIDIDVYPISTETMQRFRQFHKILQQHPGDEQEARIALAENFKDTYWYYLRYLSPQKTNLQR